MSRKSPAFSQSVQLFEQAESQLTDAARTKLLTIRPLFGDELVPRETASLPGAENLWITTPGHLPSIYWSLRNPNKIVRFLLR